MSSASAYSSCDESIFSLGYHNVPGMDLKLSDSEISEANAQSNIRETPALEFQEDDASQASSNDTEFSNTSLADTQLSMKPVKFDHEKLHLCCQWRECSHETTYLNNFTQHVGSHAATPAFEVVQLEDKTTKVLLTCRWGNCTYRVDILQDLIRHVYLHVYHSKLKSLGENSIQRMEQSLMCQGDPSLANVVPLATEDFRCAWGECSELFANIQEYYDHVRYHCLDNPKGKTVAGGIMCKWKGCKGSFPNITKLRDHVKSHTQEKLTACPTCGSLFATRTRLIDHCYRQKDEQIFSCDLCLKGFASPRLLRDHIRSHVNNYRCSQCDMSCISPSALLSHMAYRHKQDTSNPCPYCSYSAKTKSDLLRHVRIHESPILFCQISGCQFKSRNSQVLKVHQLKKHKDPPTGTYRCHLCECRYSRGNSLTRHLIGVHNLQWPSGHVRFRYKLQQDGTYSLLTVRYESEVVITAKMEEGISEPEYILPKDTAELDTSE